MQPTTRLSTGLLVLAFWLITTATQAALPTETISTTKLTSPPEDHRGFIVDFEFNNMVATRVVVVDADKQKMLGMLSTGGAAPAVLSHDRKTIYTADIFYSRYVRGDRTDVLTAWNGDTLSPAWEAKMPPKRASTLTERYGLTISDDDKFVFVYNFTPSQSITVVDTEKKKTVNELNINGCILNYAVGNRKFASLCGNGELQVITLDDNGQEIHRQHTPFFDPNKEKLVERAERGKGQTYYFVTTDGVMHPVDFSGKKPKVLPTWSLTTPQERKAGWAPGGWQLMAVAPALNRLYVLMHPDNTSGKWEDPSKTIWVFDLKTHKKVGTLKAPNLVWSLNATSDDHPLLLGANVAGGLETFDLTTGKHTGTMDGITKTPTVVLNY